MVHTIRLDNYTPTPRKLVLGTNSSFGTESIKIERGAGWDGLNLTATWHIPGREEPLRVALLDGNAMDVPPEVTKEAKDGVLVLAGLASGVQRASCNVEYFILEQAGVYGGADAEPTPELAAQVLEAALQAKADAEAAAENAAAAKANADKAQTDAEKAQQAAENAAADAAKAGPYAEAARAAQEAAKTARDAAIAAQQAAENAAAAAAASKSAADTLAAEAARAAQAAENFKAAANNAADLAGENATAAQQAAATATSAANDAGQSASNAEASKAAAETAAKAAQAAQAAAAAAKAETVKAQRAAQTAAKSAQDAQAAAVAAQKDAAASKAAAANSAAAAKASEDAAAKSAADADRTANSINESMTQIAANKEAVSQLREDLSNKITKFYASNQGETHLADSDNGKIMDMMVYGKSSQDGTPTPDNPVEIKSVVNPTVDVCGKNLLNSTLATTTMNGVTCTANKDGTYTLNGTAKSQTSFNLFNVKENIYGGKRITGCPSDGGRNTFNIVVSYYNKDKKWTSEDYEVGNGKIIKEKKETSYLLSIGLLVRAGYVCNNIIFKPMISVISEDAVSADAVSAFEPYRGQTVTLPYTLNAIPTSSGGNVTIDGQQYIADYVDVERGKLVKMVDSSKLDNTQSIVDKTEWLLAEPQEIDLTIEEITAFKALATYYPTTNISVNSEQLDGYTVFNYPISMANGWNYVKQQLNDNRDYIYDMDLQSAEAYVNSEYAVALTELEV